jgi:hypothetical protein
MKHKTVLAAVLVLTLRAADYVNSELPWHDAVRDSHDKLLAWFHPEKHQGYDHVLKLAWDFLEHKVPNDEKTGLKVFLVNAVYDAKTRQGTNWQGNPASTFGQFVDSVIAWYPYSADKESIAVTRTMLDYQLANGTTPGDWEWAKVPFATNCKNDPKYGGCVRGMETGFGGIETDKLGELGIGYVLFYELTGDRKYLDAGKACADALVKHIRPGDENHTPWPFRVNARTGEVVNGEEYGGMIVAPVRLFAELVRLKEGDVAAYERAQDTAWNWILKYPIKNDRWSGYFEDVTKNQQNVNQASPTMTAWYILTAENQEKLDPKWTGDVGHMIDWVRRRFGRGPYFGAWAIDEQGTPPDYMGCCSRAGLASDTSRWGAINAMYYERTGDAQAREDAFRSLNYATYFAADDGQIACCGLDYADSYWFDDGYGDHIRNYLWGMGAIPDFAPDGENHLLRSSSVVTEVEYGAKRIHYRTFDPAGVETLRTTFRPANVIGDGKAQNVSVRELPNGDFVVRVRRVNAKSVDIS